MNRPTGVTAAGWILVAAGAVVLVSLPFRAANPEFARGLQTFGWEWGLAFGLVAVMALIDVAAGIAVLDERNWGRLLYLWATPAALFVEWAFLRSQTDVCSSWWEIGLYVGVFVLLTRHDAREWFGAPPHPHHEAGPSPRGWALMAVAGALAAALATVVWGLGLCAYAAGNYADGFTGAVEHQFPKYVLPALALAPAFGALLGLWFARRPPTLAATPLLAAAAAVLNHSLVYLAMLVAELSHAAPPGEVALLPLIGVFLGATAAPLWIAPAFLLRSVALRLPRA